MFKALLGTITEACDDVYAALLRLQRQRQELSDDKKPVVTVRKKNHPRPVAGQAETIRKGAAGTKSHTKIVSKPKRVASSRRKTGGPQLDLPLPVRPVRKKTRR
ncbi:hypothetical protein OpiT1DRAFT_04468 [Opitutaceae bacterium TAV1]|nr:hypothetical protein OpiT1DRAFT_04468 [Opitutaceae bacterium TAV1]